MTEELKSEGKCLYCGKMFSQRGIGKHLATHLAQMEQGKLCACGSGGG
jgi:hypothetical protein